MRNGTKLKRLLLLYDVTISMNEDKLSAIMLHKRTKAETIVRGKDFTQLFNKAFTVFSKDATIEVAELTKNLPVPLNTINSLNKMQFEI